MAEENTGTRTGGASSARGPEVERRSIEGDEAMRSTEGAPALSVGGGDTVEGLSEKAQERSERWSEAASRKVGSLLHALHAAEEQLRTDGEDKMAEWAASAAEGVERMSGYLEHEDREALMGDAERVARDHPVAFLGSSFAAGLAAGRFLRASRGGSHGDGVTGRQEEDREPWLEEPSEPWDSGGASAAGLPHGEPSGPSVAVSPEEASGEETES